MLHHLGGAAIPLQSLRQQSSAQRRLVTLAIGSRVWKEINLVKISQALDQGRTFLAKQHHVLDLVDCEQAGQVLPESLPERLLLCLAKGRAPTLLFSILRALQRCQV